MTENRDSREFTGKNVEEATELALAELGVEVEEVDIEVVRQGKPGLLGFGAEPAQVRVSLRGSSSGFARQNGPTQEGRTQDGPTLEVASLACDLTQELLVRMNTSASAHLRESPLPSLSSPLIEVEGDDSGLLIGRRGETLQVLQFMVNHLLQHQIGEHLPVVVDVEGYKERRYTAITDMANRVAERVSSTGRPVTLDPMSPAERRVVHVTLSDHFQVSTKSVGTGAERQVRVFKRA